MSTVPCRPGDAAVVCYDALEAAQLGPALLEELAVEANYGKLLPLCERVKETVAKTGRVPDGIPLQTGPAYATLVALDGVLGDIDPSRSADLPAGLLDLRGHLISTGRLNEADNVGALLPRHVLPGRPGQDQDGLSAHLTKLLRVQPRDWNSVCLLRPDRDWMLVSTRDRGVLVAAAPWYGARTDVTFTSVSESGRLWYSVCPAPTLDREARVAELLDSLDTSGAEIALVPELTLDAETLRFWQERVLSTTNAETSLRWILIGTGNASAPLVGSSLIHPQTTSPSAAAETVSENSAILLDRQTSQAVLIQGKQHGFTLTAEQVGRWHLNNELPLALHTEYLSTSGPLCLLETSHGRVCILICEDLGRTQTLGALAHNLGVAIVLSPIFAPLISDGGWAITAGRDFATQVGSKVVICNSMAITRATSDGVPSHTLLVVKPAQAPVESYGTTTCWGSASSSSLTLSDREDAMLPRIATM